MSHPFKLPGMVLFNSVQETIDTISLLREKEDHEILKSLELVLRNSVNDHINTATNISQAEVWINDICDILLGTVDKKRNRNTKKYKKKIISKRIKEKLSAYILNLTKQQKEYSEFLQEFIKHLRTVYNNWEKYLFTCYDHQFLPNTNLELELSHSRMKRKHRKMTGLKNSHQFLLIHGEHFSFCFNFDHSTESLSNLLRSLNIEKFREKIKTESAKSKQRAENRLTIKNLPVVLENIRSNWN